MSVKKDLLAAADYLERHGWVQRLVKDDSGRCCASGAIREAVGGFVGLGTNERFFAATRTLRWYLIEAQGVYSSIPLWNDRLGRTKEEVVAALRAAAEKGLPS